ncbi:hypothetical protein OESDEN_17678 [Oesophagostomum dentatum]|uniref:EndoU domain-containing protein n=1 Tax=Oesophagostomum dentatum TaxID=61180 RepID=A0A0B1SBJ0_OESDE|nr:hypothetical protein OESDEN_17678 [Oesophagostomum dentatum]
MVGSVSAAFLLVFCYGATSVQADVDSGKVTDALNQLVSLDARVDSYTVISYQNMASHKDFSHDNAPNPFYTSVSESALSGATYKSLSSLMGFYNQPDVDTPEQLSGAWNASISGFLSAVVQTPVMQSAQGFLANLGKEEGDFLVF